MPAERALFLLSGGLDSTVMYELFKNKFAQSEVIFFNYGQYNLHKEREAVQRLVNVYYHPTLPLDKYSQGVTVAPRDGQVPEDSVITFRNGVLISMAALIAQDGAILIAQHKTVDAYPDCTDKFFQAMKLAVLSGTGGKVTIASPFRNISKADIVLIGKKNGVAMENTWSCYDRQEVQCGICVACKARKAAFKEAEVVDPTTYANY